jgi:DNA-binding transcriptional ArsR family regulator
VSAGALLKDKHVIWDYLDTEGQIIKALIEGPLVAGAIYRKISASQPIVSKKLARLQDEGIVECQRDTIDRRVVWYQLSAAFMEKLLGDPEGVSASDPIFFVKNETHADSDGR